MALLIDNAHIYVRNHVKGTLEKTEYIFQSSSIVRLAIHPSTTTWKHEEDLKILADYTNTSVLTVADTTVVKVGMRVSGNGIPEGTKVDEIIDQTKFNMSNVSFGGQHQAAEITLSDSFSYCQAPGGSFVWIRDSVMKKLQGVAPVLKISSFTRPDGWTEPINRLYDVNSG